MTSRMPTHRILILNGPNLGHIGQRQPEIYGFASLDQLPSLLAQLQPKIADRVTLSFYQNNHEGNLIDHLESVRRETDGVVLNAGALTHTSLALADCLAWIKLPCVEVHLSNVWARPEPLRHTTLLAPHCLGVVAGFGLMSYVFAVAGLCEHLDS